MLGKRIMDKAGDHYVPLEAKVLAAGGYRGKVNSEFGAALRGGNFSATTVTMSASDIMMKWHPKTQMAKKAAAAMFVGFLRATGRHRLFFPEKEDLRGGQWSQPSAVAEEQVLTEFAVMRVMAGCTPDTAGGAVSNVRT